VVYTLLSYPDRAQTSPRKFALSGEAPVSSRELLGGGRDGLRVSTRRTVVVLSLCTREKGRLLVPGLSVAAFVSGALCMRGKYSDSKILIYVFKPLTTMLLLGVAVAAGAFATTYGRLVALSIVFSLAGDIFLMLPKDRFINGLLSFLVAHVVLIVAFALQATGLSWWLLIPIAAGIGMYSALAPHLGRMKIPVVVYITVIAAMAWFALERWHLQGSTSAALAALGSVFFLYSDSTLALNRFRAKFRLADFLVLSTYYASIWLIALSVHRGWM